MSLPCSAADAQKYTLSGEIRGRYETLDNQFRAGRDGGDQLAALRSLVRADYWGANFSLHGELHDARTYLDDAATPLSTSFVNTFAVLQAYLSVPIHGSNTHTQSRLNLGRFSLDIGSRRFVERNDFRNTINAFTGAHWQSNWQNAAALDAFYVAPVDKLPFAPNDLADNKYESDETNWDRRFWGIHWRQPEFYKRLQVDTFIYGLYESDTDRRPTLDRQVYAPGFRLVTPPQTGAFDFELEAAFRFGHQSASILPDAKVVDVRAHLLHFDVGYTFDHPWSPRIGLEYDWASGDKKATSTYERYDRFYGTRRGDLGNTSIYGPLTRSNISVPGVRLSFHKGPTDGRLVLQQAFLAAAADSWVIARLRDPSGQSGKNVGTMLDFRVRRWLSEAALRLEMGGSALWFDNFAKDVPGGPSGSRTLYGYTQLTWYF